MRIRERMTAVTVAVMTCVVVASTQVQGVAAADETYGEFAVGGRILEAYKATGGEAKWGDPTMNEAPAAAGGRFQRFDNTSFYWKASVAGGVAHQIGGAIRARWGTLKYERGVLGYPTSDEVDAAGKGRKQFLQGGNLYYGASTGTHPVWGKILDIYGSKGGPGQFYGMPVGDEYRTDDGKFAQDFQGGTIIWP